MIIESDLERQICKMLRGKGYLSKRESFHFTLCEIVETASYNNDIYLGSAEKVVNQLVAPR